MQLKENVLLAFESIRNNFLRSILTLLIIAVGIGCLVGILTAIDNVLYSMNNSFSKLGANSFSIVQSEQKVKKRQRGRSAKRGEPIYYADARLFKERYAFSDATVSLDVSCGNVSAMYQSKKTSPTIRTIGIDEAYISNTSLKLEYGRNFSNHEIQSSSNAVIIGHNIAKQLFTKVQKSNLGRIISLNAMKYRVVGILKEEGSKSGGSVDSQVLIPILKAKNTFGHQSMNYNIKVAMSDPKNIEEAISSAIGTFRNIRKLKANQDNNFEIAKSDGVMDNLKSMTSTLRLATVIIAALTLFGAAIGLMNIMLVSVTERTKEIGVRKALGATSSNIRTQFLVEAITICILGGILGIIFGIILGFGVTIAVKGSFIIPWNWMTLGIVVCVIVGVISGLYPAIKASRLDPIESLRYE